MISDWKGCGRAFSMLMLVLTAACTTPHDRPVEWQQTVRARGTITMIDHQERRMVVRNGFHSMTVRVAESVGHFEDRKVGDTLEVLFHRAVVVAPASRDGTGAKELTKYQLSPATETQPAIALARARQFTAEFIEFDYQSSIAVFRVSDNSYPALVVPLGLRPFVRTLVPGDRVAVSIEDAISISVRPAG